MDRSTGGPDRAADDATTRRSPIAEPRQRWRLVFGRPVPSERTHRELADAWLAALESAGLPLPRTEGRPRPPLAFAAPLPVGVVAERELADLWVARRLPIGLVREALTRAMPGELSLLDLFDVWLGAPALAASLTAAEYRVTVDGVPAADLAMACRQLLASPELPRERARAGGTVRYDLRPLIGDLAVEPAAPPSIRMRTLFHPERGAGRPEEVVAALGDVLGREIELRGTVRERLVLDGEA